MQGKSCLSRAACTDECYNEQSVVLSGITGHRGNFSVAGGAECR